MTFKRVLFLFVLSMLCISLSAQFASFRALSTAGLLDDNIEAILAVTEMTYVDGFNVFTNLSNFSYASEDIFDGSSGNYLIGFKGSMMDMLHLGFLSSSYGYNYGDSTTTNYTTYTDNNGDEQYDQLETAVEDYCYDAGSNSSTNFLAFAFGKPEGVKAGFSYTNYRNNYSYNEAYVWEERDSNMISGDLNRLNNYWYDYSNLSNSTDNMYSINGAFSTGQLEFAIDLGLGFYKGGYFYHVDDSFFEDLTPSTNAFTNEIYYHGMNDYHYNQDALNFNFGILSYYRMNEDSIEFGVGFSNTNYEKEYLFYDGVMTYNVIFPGIVTDETMSYRDTFYYGDSLSPFTYSSTSWNIGGKYVKKLEKAHFAMGMTYGQSKYAYLDTMHYNYRIDMDYDNGDGVTDANDFTYLETGNYTSEYGYNYLYSYIYLPVGIEYNFWGPLHGRLGANTQLSWGNNHESFRFLAFNPGTQIYTYGDGSTYEYLNETQSEREEYVYDSFSFQRTTYYSFGLCWDVSKNVKIDLMNYTDLTSIENWSISANVKF